MAVVRDDFEYWLFDMDQELAVMMDGMPDDVAKVLDYSVESLSVVESWVLSRYPTVPDILKESEKLTLDRLARYVGETIRKTVGGVWDIDLSDPQNAYYRLPVVSQQGKWLECPVTLITAATDRRTGKYIELVVQRMQDRYAVR
jgi:hypothetical protein